MVWQLVDQRAQEHEVAWFVGGLFVLVAVPMSVHDGATAAVALGRFQLHVTGYLSASVPCGLHAVGPWCTHGIACGAPLFVNPPPVPPLHSTPLPLTAGPVIVIGV